MKKILIDSDVCLDSITGRYPYSIEAGQLLQSVEDRTMIGFISAESFSNMFYILRKLSSASKAIEQIKHLRSIVHVGHLKESTVDRALSSGWNDFEDALQHFCAVENSCDAIVTRNRSDFIQSEIPVYTPLEILDLIR